jgi:hypothetical protein
LVLPAKKARAARVESMAGIPLFSCRFTRLWFFLLFGRRRFFFARMGETKIWGFFKKPPKRGFSPQNGVSAQKGGFAPFVAHLRAAFWELFFYARLEKKGGFPSWWHKGWF